MPPIMPIVKYSVIAPLTESSRVFGFDPTDAFFDVVTWGSGATSPVWTFDVSGTNHTMTASSGLMTFSDDVDVDGDLDVLGHSAFGGTASVSDDVVLDLAETFDDPGASKTGLRFTITATGTVGANDIFGLSGNSILGAVDGNVTGEVIGLAGQITAFDPGNHTVDCTKNVLSKLTTVEIVGSATITDAYGFFADAGLAGFGSMAVTNQYGLYIEAQALGTNTWGVFQAGASDKNFFAGELKTGSGRVVNTTRLTSNTTLDATHHVVFCDTDGGAFTITLPAGVDGTYYRIINVGSSGNDVTIAPTGAELLTGANASRTLSDSSVIILVYESAEGWW